MFENLSRRKVLAVFGLAPVAAVAGTQAKPALHKNCTLLDPQHWVEGEALQAASPLESFPTEPTVPVTKGQPTVGFTGLATLDGVVIGEIQSATIRIRTANAVAPDTFGSYLPQLAEGGMREPAASIDIEVACDTSKAIDHVKRLTAAMEAFRLETLRASEALEKFNAAGGSIDRQYETADIANAVHKALQQGHPLAREFGAFLTGRRD